MLPILQAKGLLRDAEMHPYHCDCGACDFDRGFPLRAQTDSSCAGELISRPYGTRGNPATTAYELMEAIQEAAVQSDAVPGMRAGFHVHVSAASLDTQQRQELVWQWARWEPTMEAIASGPFRVMRDFNGRVRPNVSCGISYDGEAPHRIRYREAPFPEMLTWAGENEERLSRNKSYCYQFHYESDRHSLLAVRTRFDTFEFRLWNSTRSAWRMELFTRLSCGWMRPRLHAALAERSPVEPSEFYGTLLPNEAEVNMRLFLDALNASGSDDRTCELLDRQIAYRVEHANDILDPVFTAA